MSKLSRTPGTGRRERLSPAQVAAGVRIAEAQVVSGSGDTIPGPGHGGLTAGQ